MSFQILKKTVNTLKRVSFQILLKPWKPWKQWKQWASRFFQNSENSENNELPDSSKTVRTVKTMSFQILPKQWEQFCGLDHSVIVRRSLEPMNSTPWAPNPKALHSNPIRSTTSLVHLCVPRRQRRALKRWLELRMNLRHVPLGVRGLRTRIKTRT